MKLKSKSRVEGFTPKFTADNFLAVLVGYFHPAFDLSDDAWDSIRLVDTLCENRFPVRLCQCQVFEGRWNVLPSVYRPGRRNELTETACLNPETVFIAKDPVLQKMEGVFLVVATRDKTLPFKWMMRQGDAARMIVGDHMGLRLVAAPLSSFV